MRLMMETARSGGASMARAALSLPGDGPYKHIGVKDHFDFCAPGRFFPPC